MKRLVLRLALASAVIGSSLTIGLALGASAPATLEAAKQARSASHSAVVSAEAALAADRASEAAAAKVVTAIEAEAPKEEPPKEEPPVGAVVGKAPVGPPAPASGWHLGYGDAFGAAFGSGAGQDNTFAPITGADGCFGCNSKIATASAANAKITPNGLELQCTSRGGGLYTCAGGTTDAAFEFNFATTGEWAVELVAQWPTCHGDADPGWWTYTNAMEIDFFEGWCFGGPHDWSESNAGIPVVVGQPDHCACHVTQTFGFDPSAATHRYVTDFKPIGSGRYTVSEYIDGVFKWSIPATIANTSDGLIVTNGMRESSGGFTTGAQTFLVRSIAFYQDGAHAGQGIRGGGVAPGTSVK